MVFDSGRRPDVVFNSEKKTTNDLRFGVDHQWSSILRRWPQIVGEDDHKWLEKMTTNGRRRRPSMVFYSEKRTTNGLLVEKDIQFGKEDNQWPSIRRRKPSVIFFSEKMTTSCLRFREEEHQWSSVRRKIQAIVFDSEKKTQFGKEDN